MAMPSSLSLVALLTTAILSADGSTVLVETVGELKAAILDASVSTIETEAGSPYMLDSTLDISRSVALRAAAGQRATLDGGGARRVMSIRAGAVSLTGLVLTRGRSSNGAGLYVRDSSSFGGLDPPVVTIADCVFSENVAAYNSAGGPCVGEPARGAGIYVDSGTSLTMTASQVKSNSGPPACNTGRPAEAFGIGLFVAGEASISNCAIKENAGSRADGGGLFVAGGAKVSMVSTTVVDNVAVCAAVPPCSPLHAHPSRHIPVGGVPKGFHTKWHRPERPCLHVCTAPPAPLPRPLKPCLSSMLCAECVDAVGLLQSWKRRWPRGVGWLPIRSSKRADRVVPLFCDAQPCPTGRRHQLQSTGRRHRSHRWHSCRSERRDQPRGRAGHAHRHRAAPEWDAV